MMAKITADKHEINPDDLLVMTLCMERPRWQFWNRKPKTMLLYKLVGDRKWTQITTRYRGVRGVK